ncbi:uncharacterized protein LOC105198799 [Solenopsis invicta]|uniref:uncharacterized protein LOC105198799 n=1 Tax=Solenopsis invicta TaxID=13686 RepID=UPI000E340014|nr:uncharacterized protein LOC105198799 [Solenopsis invicta]
MKYEYIKVIEWSRKIGCPKVTQVSCWMFILLIICSRQTQSLVFDNTTDFVQKCQLECSFKKDYTTCGKYKVVKWLNTVVKEKEFSYGPFRIIRIPSIYKQSFLPYLPRSRAFKSGITETLTFVRDSVEDLLTTRAIVYTIDNSAGAREFSSNLMLMDEDELDRLKESKEPEGDWRIFKKKKSIILPILILLNLVKLKLLLLPIFLGVHFIKKLLVLGSLILPSVFAHLRICKVPRPNASHGHHAHPYQIWSTAEDTSVDYPTGYGQDDTNWHRNDYQLGYPSYQILRNPYG